MASVRFRRRLLISCAWLCSLACAASEHAVLERGNGPEPSTLDAHRCQEVSCANILRDLYEGLISEDASGNLIPGLAARWQVSANQREWTFWLREDARWSDGSEITVQQVIASFSRASDPATMAPLVSVLKDIRAVDSPADGAIRFHLHRPLDLLPRLSLPIAFPVRVDLVERWGAQHTQAAHWVGNGAYVLTEWTPQSSLRLRRNPHFHSPAAIDEVRYHVTEDAAAEYKRFLAGDLHLTETVPPARLVELQTRHGDALRISPYLGVFFLGINLRQGPLAESLPLRQALSLAIDRERLVNTITGMGELPAERLLPPALGLPLPTSSEPASARHREARARALYAEAGFSSASPLQIELRFNTSTPHRRMALAVAAMWREVLGVRTRLRNEEWKVFVQNRRQGRVTEVFRGGWIADMADPASFLDLFRSDSELNWSGWRDRDYDHLLDAAQASSDAAQRADLQGAAERRLLAAQAILPLYFYTSKHLVSPEVEGFEANPLDRHPSRFLRWRDEWDSAAQSPSTTSPGAP